MRTRPTTTAFLSIAFALATTLRAAPWVPIGPSGGWVGSVLAAPSDGRVLYATAPDLYRSDDGGSTWTLQSTNTSWLAAVDPRDPLRLFVTGEQGLAVSSDGGRTFVQRNPRNPRAVVLAVTFFPGSSQSMLAATTVGILRTGNGGRSWKATGLTSEVGNVVISPRNPNLWVALESVDWGTHNPSGTVWRSADAGRTWTQRDVGYGPYGITGPTFDPLDPSRVYLMDGGLGLLVSRDGGDTFDTAPGSPRATVVRPAADGSLYAANLYSGEAANRLLVSRDHGETWSRPGGGTGSGPADSVTQFIVNGSTLLACGSRGIWRSGDDGRIWRAASLGINNLRSTSIAVSSDGATVYLGVLGEGVYRGDGASAGWVRARRGLPVAPALDLETWHAVSTVASRPDRAFDLTPAGLFVSDDRAASWRRVKLPRGFDVSRANALALDGVSADRLALIGGRDTHLSEDGGGTWRTVLSEYAEVFAFDGGDPDRLYALTDHGIQRSADRGRTWQTVPWLVPPGNFIEHLWTLPNEAGVLFVALAGGGLYGSDDGGSTFTRLTDGPPGHDLHVTHLTPDPERPDNLYLLVQRIDATSVHTQLMAFSRSNHSLRVIDDESAPLIGAIAARPRSIGEVFGAGASAFRLDDQP